MIRFSLIVPFHNASGSDRRVMMTNLVHSIPDRPDLEVLWVDDHSTISWAPDFPHAETCHRRLASPQGQRYAGAARNHALEHAKGTHILFADSDDLFDTQGINEVLDSVVDLPECDLTLFRVSAFRDDAQPATRHLYLSGAYAKIQESGEADHLVQYPSPVGKIIRSRFIRENGLSFSHHRFGNDVLFGMSLALARPRMSFHDSIGYLIREGNTSLTQDPSKDAVMARFQRARDVQDLMTSANRPDLVRTMRHLVRRHARAHPVTVLVEVFRSAATGYTVFGLRRKLFGRSPASRGY